MRTRAVAAIAAAHGLLVFTRNLRHFAALGVPRTDLLDAPPP